MKLKNQLLAPPGGWRYQQPETGHWMMDITEESLLRKIAQHRANNNLPHVNPPFETIAADVENWICEHLSLEDQSNHCDGGVRYKEGVHFSEVVGFIQSNLAYFASGKKQVTQTEAERRASICATCPLNVSVTGCGACQKAIQEYREKIATVQATSSDANLKACGVCGCDLKTIVHFPLETLRAKGEREFPAWCWQQRGGVNTIEDQSVAE
jgi:hypothetical protein